MAILKCKMCGGNIEPIEGQGYGTCDSCGNTMTLPKANDEKILNLFNRANHYRMQKEFDKALATYENILLEEPDNAEAHWGCVLSKFGIEYVVDPKTHKHIPTLHRVQKESILVSLDYKAALKNADFSAGELYQKEAEQIEEIQKRILSVANNEEPYDIFVCYKESDDYGKRTIDSVLAQDIYQQLTSNGYRVFFSRITLEDKVGVEYEPYIFSALNSSKIMLVIGTKPEYFNAVWVKNEWARFLAMSREDSRRILMPCYRDMDAYELPEELAIFQSQDMGKIGFIQDLLRGIQKVMEGSSDSSQRKEEKSSGFNRDNAIVLAKTALQTKNWNEALNQANLILSKEPTCSEAWDIKMKAIEMQVLAENYEEMRLEEIKACGENVIKYANASDAENLKATCEELYERCFEGYLKKFRETINSTVACFQNGWGNLQYAYLQAGIAKVKKIYIYLADMSLDEESITNPKNVSLVKELYKVLKEREKISKDRINQWNLQFKAEQEAENEVMTEKLACITKAMATMFPEIFVEDYEKLHSEVLEAERKREKVVNIYRIITKVSLIVACVSLFPAIFIDSDEGIWTLFMLATTWGFIFAPCAYFSIPFERKQREKQILLLKEAEENYKKEVEKLGIKIE